MRICVNEDGKFNLYEMKENKEKIEEYKRGKLEDLSKYRSYNFKTTDLDFARAFNTSFEIDCTDAYYINKKNRPNCRKVDGGLWESSGRGLNEDIEKYINGDYYLKLPIRAYQLIHYGSLPLQAPLARQEDMFYLIKTKVCESMGLIGKQYSFSMFSIPKELYLLQMLQLGFLKEVAFKDIDEQLKLFDYSFLDTLKPIYLEDVSPVEHLFNDHDAYPEKKEDLKNLLRIMLTREMSLNEEIAVNTHILKRALKVK